MSCINGDDGKERTKKCNRHAQFLYYCPYRAYSTVIATTASILFMRPIKNRELQLTT